MAQVYVPTPDDFRALRRAVNEHRKVYQAQFDAIRDQYIAHREVTDPEAVANLFGKAQLRPLEALLLGLEALHTTLQDLYQNGTRPEIRLRAVDLQAILEMPTERMPRQHAPEMAVYDVRRSIAFIVAGSPEWIRDMQHASLPTLSVLGFSAGEFV